MVKRINQIVALIFLTLILSGCIKTTSATEVIAFQPNDYDIYFLSDNANKQLDELFLDTILEVKAKYPDSFPEAIEMEKNLNDIDYSEDSNGPYLIIVKDGQTVTQLSGETSREELFMHLEDIIVQ